VIESPCIDVCQMDPRRRLCVGCHRTLEEIARWAEMSDAERAGVLADLSARRGAPKKDGGLLE